MTVIVRLLKVTFPPASLYCRVNVLFEPAVIATADTVLACCWAGVTALLDDWKDVAVLSLAAKVVVPLIAKLRKPAVAPPDGAIRAVTTTRTSVVDELLNVTAGLGEQPVIP
jgi:hypothetical protein